MSVGNYKGSTPQLLFKPRGKHSCSLSSDLFVSRNTLAPVFQRHKHDINGLTVFPINRAVQTFELTSSIVFIEDNGAEQLKENDQKHLILIYNLFSHKKI